MVVLIKVVVKQPYKKAEITEVENSLESFQKIVGGHIEFVPSVFQYPIGIYCNEEGKLEGLPPNIVLPHGDFAAGTIVVISTDLYGNTIGLTESQAERCAELLNILGNYFGYKE